mmetsp:Transcript_7566/g.25880  ORF Transcript_7566/g.25880 Transcript_7566/m.25880 type:complete len:288 (-) Transcript_7566:35-898(-)
MVSSTSRGAGGARSLEERVRRAGLELALDGGDVAGGEVEAELLVHLGLVEEEEEAEGLEDGLVVDELLRDEAGRREHREAAVLELLRRHLVELGGVRGLEAQGVEADVAGVVVLVELADGRAVLGERPALERAVHLEAADGEGADLEEGGVLLADLGEVVDGRALDVREERVERLGDEEAEHREHGDAAVLRLGLAVAADVVVAGVDGEARGVPLAHGRQAAGQTEREIAVELVAALLDLGDLVDGVRLEHGLDGRVRRHEGRGRGAGEGDDELLHGCCVIDGCDVA